MKQVLSSILLALALILADNCGDPVHAQAPAQDPAPAPDLSIPEWRLLTPPGGSAALACFDQEGIRQILRVQEQARYSLRLVNLHLTLETQTQALVGELQATQREYAALRAVLTERNERLSEEVLAAQAVTERYRVRLERRRIWPWIALGFGLVAGTTIGIGVAR